jgi:hypothetical protein
MLRGVNATLLAAILSSNPSEGIPDIWHSYAMPASRLAPAYNVSKAGSRQERGKNRSGQCCAGIRGLFLAYVLL